MSTQQPPVEIDAGEFLRELNEAWEKGYRECAAGKPMSVPNTLGPAPVAEEKPPSAVDLLLRPPHVLVDDLDMHGEIWGLRTTEGCANGCVELYIEDDGFWHLKATFDRQWLPELARLTEQLRLRLYGPHE